MSIHVYTWRHKKTGALLLSDNSGYSWQHKKRVYLKQGTAMAALKTSYHRREMEEFEVVEFLLVEQKSIPVIDNSEEKRAKKEDIFKKQEIERLEKRLKELKG